MQLKIFKFNEKGSTCLSRQVLPWLISIVLMMSTCFPNVSFAGESPYIIKDETSAAKIGEFTHEGKEIDIYKLHLDTTRFDSIKDKPFSSVFVCILPEIDALLNVNPLKEQMIRGIPSIDSDEFKKAKKCYEDTKGELPSDIVNSCTEENTIGFFWAKGRIKKIDGKVGPRAEKVIGYLIIEWPANTAAGANKDALVKAIEDTPLDSDTLYYHREDRYNGKETSEKGFWKDMQATLNNAKDLFEDRDPAKNIKSGIGQEEVDSATAALTEAIKKLVPKEQLNATYLYETVKEVEAVNPEELKEYTEPSVDRLQSALQEAKDYLESLFTGGEATAENAKENQEKADGYADELKKAKQNIVHNDSIRMSKRCYNTIVALDRFSTGLKKEDFTADSWKTFEEAKEAADRLIAEHPADDRLPFEYLQKYREITESYWRSYYGLSSSFAPVVNLRFSDDFGLRYPKEYLDKVFCNKVTLAQGEDSLEDLLKKAGVAAFPEFGRSRWNNIGNERLRDGWAVYINGVLIYKPVWLPSDVGISIDYWNSGGANTVSWKDIRIKNGDDVVISHIELALSVLYVGNDVATFDKTVGFHRIMDLKLKSDTVKAGEPISGEIFRAASYIEDFDGKKTPYAGGKLAAYGPQNSDGNWPAGVILSDDSGVLTLVKEGKYLVSAFEPKWQDKSNKSYPNLTVSSHPVSATVTPLSEGELQNVKNNYIEKLDSAFAACDKEAFKSETYEDIQKKIVEAKENISAASDLASVVTIFNEEMARFEAVKAAVEDENKVAIEKMTRLLLILPTEDEIKANLFSRSYTARMNQALEIYGSMTEYQRKQLTGNQIAQWEAITGAWGEDGSSLPAENKIKIRAKVEGGHGDKFSASIGIYNQPLVTGKGQIFAYSKSIPSMENEVILEVPAPAEYFSAEFYHQDTPEYEVYDVKAEGIPIRKGVRPPFKPGGTHATLVESLFETYGAVRNDVTITLYVRSTGDLDMDKGKAKERLSKIYADYQKSEYTAEGWRELTTAYNEGVAAIERAANATDMESAIVIAADAMRAVKTRKQLAAPTDPTVGELGSIHVVVENTTYSGAPKDFRGKFIDETMPLDKDSTMMNCVLKALEKNGYGWNGTGGQKYNISYLSHITKDGASLGEFDGANTSGWMGTLNDWFTNEGFSSFTAGARERDYRIVDGDEIRIMFTMKGYGEDLGGTWGNSDTGLAGLSVSGGILSPAFKSDTVEYVLSLTGGTVSVMPTAANKNYQVKTFVNEKPIVRNKEYYRRGESISVKAGDVIYIGVGERAWLSMNNQGAEARDYKGTWYSIKVVDGSSADDAISLINNIATLTYSNYKKQEEKVVAARAAYDGLNADAKEKVTNLDKLISAEKTIVKFRQIDDVKALLAGLVQSSRATDDQVVSAKSAIERADRAYKALDKEQKGYITVGDVANYNALVKRLSTLVSTTATAIAGAEYIPDGNVLSPEAKVSGSKAVVSVNETEVTEAVKAAKAGKKDAVTIAPTGAEKVKSLDVSIPKAAAKEIAGQKDLKLNIETPLGDISIPTDALGSIAGSAVGSDIIINIEKKEKSDVKDKSINTSSGIAVSVTITSGGKEITSFGGKSITIDLPVDSRFKDGGVYNVIQISKDGSQETIKGVCKKQYGKLFVRISVNHLSTFVVLNEKLIAFTDIVGHWAEDGIKYAYTNGIMNGTSETKFSPDAALSRAMLVTMLYRLDGSPAVNKASSFKDVAAGKWFTDSISWASENDIVSGYGEGIFNPDANITREQMAAILYRYSKYKKYDVSKTGELSGFKDMTEIKPWALESIKWANGEGLIGGRTKNAIVPNGNATRGEAAVILMRFVENTSKQKEKS